MMNNQKKIACPICGKQNTWQTENTCRPFCSDRCKLIDLGEWANETRKLPGEQFSDFLPSDSNTDDFEHDSSSDDERPKSSGFFH